jgi:nucleotide-binding universal stress UspA family protein
VITYHMTRQVVVAIDDSGPATAALEHALRRFADATITVLHVIDADEPDGSLRQRVLPAEYDAHRNAAEETAETVLENARAYADEYGVAVSTVTRYGNPARQITAYAEENDVDRILIGTHGRSGLSRLLLGSLSELVAQRSSVPVTAVHEPTATERATPAPADPWGLLTKVTDGSPTFRRCPGCAVTLHTPLEFCPGCLGVTLPSSGRST